MSKCKLLTLVVSIFLCYQSNVFAIGSGGISNEGVSAEHLGTLLSILGSKTDPTVVYNNPASIGDLGKFSGTVGMTYYNFSAERTANGVTEKMETTNAVVPNFGVSASFHEGKIGAGLAVLSPYGLQTEWSETSSVRYVATESTLKMIDITPGVSFRPSEEIAFGIGADYFLTFDTDLQKKAPVDAVNAGLCQANPLLCPPTSGAPDANSRLSGDGNQWGYHAGVLYNPSPNHTLGVTYHSEVKTRIEGDLELSGLTGASALVFGGSDFKTPAYTDLFYPQNVQFGYKYSQKKWEAGVGFAWYDWSSNTQLAINLPNATAAQKSIAGAPIPLAWRDVWSVALGGSLFLSNSWKLNGGQRNDARTR